MNPNESFGPLFEYHPDSRRESSAGVLETSKDDYDERDTCSTCHNGGFCSKHDKRDGIIPPQVYVSDIETPSAGDPVTDEERDEFFEQLRQSLEEK